MDEAMRRRIREAVHGDPDKPVTLTLGGGSAESGPPDGRMQVPHENGAGMGHQNGHGPRPVAEGLQLDPNVVLQEIRRLNPTLVDLALHRVALRIREQELTTLQQALEELTADRDRTENAVIPEGEQA